MSESEPEGTYLEFVVQRGAEPIHGFVRGRDEGWREFAGWIALASELESARQQEAQDEG